MATRTGDFFHYRWRTLLAGAVGAATGWALDHAGAKASVAALAGWNVAAALFLVPTLWMLLFDDAEGVRKRAGREDENRAIMMSLILAAVVTSLAGIVMALAASKTHDAHGAAQHPGWVLALSASTLILNWLTVQSLFTLHYAHRYFGDKDGDGTADRGLQFNGDPPSTYRDFIYVAVCIGATFQVSDFNVTNTRFRNLITTHALISFVFNTMVLALGINILGNLLGQ